MSRIARTSGNAGGRLLIKEIHIENFRCYQLAEVAKCGRVNLIVGDNGVGKTALLEAVFLALGSSPEIAVRFRALRGLDANVQGPATVVETAIFRDIFFNGDMKRTVRISLKATGRDKRSVTVRRNFPQSLTVPVDDFQQGIGAEPRDSSGGLKFVWTDSHETKHEVRALLGRDGLRVEPFNPGEQLEAGDDNFFYLTSTFNTNASETAGRFSELDISGGKEEFLEIFRSEFDWIEDISVQMNGGAGLLYASVSKPTKAMRPLGYISGGINKIVNLLLCVANARDGVVLIDEIENGIHYRHHAAVWRMLFALAKKTNTQLILSTHSEEWLEALLEVDPKYRDDFCLWRVQRGDKSVGIEQFGGKQAIAAIEAGSEVR